MKKNNKKNFVILVSNNKQWKNYKLTNGGKIYKKIIVRYYVKNQISLIISSLFSNKNFNLKFKIIKFYILSNILCINKEKKEDLIFSMYKIKKNIINRFYVVNNIEYIDKNTLKKLHPIMLDYNDKKDSFWIGNFTSSKVTKLKGIEHENLCVGNQYGSNKKCYLVKDDIEEVKEFSKKTKEEQYDVFNQFKPMNKELIQDFDGCIEICKDAGMEITNKETFEELQNRIMNKKD